MSRSISAASSDAGEASATGCNLALIFGVLSSPAGVVELPSGARLTSLRATARGASGQAQSIPITLIDAPDWVAKLDAGDEIVACGEIHHRFFRAGGATASRTEMRATHVARRGDRRAVGRVLARVHRVLETSSAPGR
jgi:hypothetical protein